MELNMILQESYGPGQYNQNQKVRSILSFLDECAENQNGNRPVEPAAVAKVEPIEKLKAETVIDKIKSQLVAMRLEDKRNKGKIATLELSLEKSKKSKASELEQANERLTKLMHDQKIEYENAMQRQLQFVDQLLEDKKSLTEKAEGQYRLAEAARQLSETQAVEREKAFKARIEKLKKEWGENERMRRTLWAKEKQEVIRASLNNEINGKLANNESRHSRTMRELTERHEKEIATLKAMMNRDASTRVQNTKNAMTKEFDEQLFKLEQDRMRENIELSHKNEEDVRKSKEAMLKEFESERARWMEERRKDQDDFEKELKKAQSRSDERLAAVDVERQEEVEKVRRRASMELAKAKERMRVELEERAKDLRERHEKDAVARDKAFREKTVIERNQQIELVVEKFSAEATASERLHESQMKTACEALRKKMEDAEMGWRTRHERLTELYREACIGQEQFKQNSTEINENIQRLTKRKEELELKLSRIEADRSVDEQKWKERLKACETECAEKAAVAEGRIQQAAQETGKILDGLQKQIAECEERRSSEMSEVESRVRAAMANKDGLIATLRNQLESKELRIQHMDRVLAQYKRDMLEI